MMYFAILIWIPSLVTAAETQFLSIGDWGASNAKKISDYMGDYNPEWLIAIGDNFYSDGVSGWDDPQFKSKFENTFTAKSLQVPWYICAGNHDYYGGNKGVQGEIEYSKHSDRWKFPKLYFDQVVKTSDGTTTVHLISVDTWRINGGDTYVKYDPVTNRSALRNKTNIEWRYQIGADDMGKAKHDILLKTFDEEDPNDPIQVRDDQTQLDWIKTTLAGSTADWKVVFGHFPIYSATTGEHGDTKSLIKLLLPILKDGGADFYGSGHDHILQHINRGDKLHFFGSGAGAMKHKGVDDHYKGLMGVQQGSFGFMVHYVNKTALRTVFVNDQGKTGYTYTIHK